MGGKPDLGGPDLRLDGVPIEELQDGVPRLGRVGDAPVAIARLGEHLVAYGAVCTHWNGPLHEGTIAEGTARCPLHHARFSLRSGEAVGPPALKPIDIYEVRSRGGRAYVAGRKAPEPEPRRVGRPPTSVVVIGGGAAASTAVETLRREGYAGPVAIIGEDPHPPYDRPNLSKAFLAGTAPEDWIPLRPRRFYEENDIELLLGSTVSRIDPVSRRVHLEGGSGRRYGALLLATGARPRTLSVPGAELPHVRTLRSLADARELVARSERARRAVVVGASFIGLEVAASLRQRDLEVHVVAPERLPMERPFGPEVASFVLALHESKGVRFHLERSVRTITETAVHLDDGTRLEADLVVVGVGVEPRTRLAESARIRCDGGILVDEYLQTSEPWIYAAGDVARWPDARVGRRLRVEHWVVAQRQGRVAALNMLGLKVPFDAVPFFWSDHYEVAICYVGHAESWDDTVVSGSIRDRDATIGYRKDGRILAVATIRRDGASLEAEVALERDDQPRLRALLAS